LLYLNSAKQGLLVDPYVVFIICWTCL
jgi:hypothetical protein